MFKGCDESGDDVFKLRSETEGEESVAGQSENEAACCGWESSMSEFETDADVDAQVDAAKHEKFKSMRAQHYFMRQSLQRGKDLIETDDDE